MFEEPDDVEIRTSAVIRILRELGPVDGVRGTWSRMLEPGRRGHGLVPWIADLGWWDQVYNTTDVTQDQPILLPAIVEWSAPTLQELHEMDMGFPWVRVRKLTAFGSDGDYMRHGYIQMVCPDDDCMEWIYDVNSQIIDKYEDDPDRRILYGLPVWSVTPIDDEYARHWAKILKTHWDQFSETTYIPYLSSDRFMGCAIFYDNEGYCSLEQPCDACAAYQDAEQLLCDRITDTTYWPDQFDDQFAETWKWAVTRWVHAWTRLATTREDYECPSFWVSSHSPYSGTRRSDALAREIERASSMPSTSSQLSLEFSTAV